MVDEAIDGRECHGWIGEDLDPFAERLVGRDQHGSALVTRGDQLEEHAGFGLILGDVGDVVQDQQIIMVELGDGGLQRQFSPRHLQPLHEVGGAREQHAPAVFNQRQAERCRQMALAAAGRDSVTMPGVRRSRCESSILFILGPENWCKSSTASGSPVRIIWSWFSWTARTL